jgi:uncharacterized protein YoxC
VALAAFTWSDLGELALAIFLIAVGAGLLYALVRLGETFGRLSSLIRGTERELLPVIDKLGGTVDRVNGQLDKVDRATESAVDAVVSADRAVRAVSYAVTQPVRRATGLAAAVTHGAAALRASRSWSDAVSAGKDAAARRERDFDEELGS